MTYDDIHTQYFRTIRSQVSKVLSDQTDRDDCIQNVLLTLWRSHESEQLPIGPTLTSYVVTTAKHAALKFRCTNARRNSVISSSIDAPRGESEPTYDSRLFADVSPVTSTPVTRAIRDAADNLPLLLREVVKLRFYDDMSVAEIATHLAITETAVTSRLSRAYTFLRNTSSTCDKHVA
jgi:RNA polymerase sigma factor (sigma-70 family)